MHKYMSRCSRFIFRINPRPARITPLNKEGSARNPGITATSFILLSVAGPTALNLPEEDIYRKTHSWEGRFFGLDRFLFREFSAPVRSHFYARKIYFGKRPWVEKENDVLTKENAEDFRPWMQANESVDATKIFFCFLCENGDVMI